MSAVATAPAVRGMSYWRARAILTQPLVFGEPIQIEAREFVELYYGGHPLDELTDLVEWIQEEEEP
jgi:hypothetical protein